MKGTSVILLLVLLLAFASISLGQERRNPEPAPSPTKNLPFDPHDFSGIWRFRGGGGFAMNKDAPAMTPWAKAKYDAAIPAWAVGTPGVISPSATIQSWCATR